MGSQYGLTTGILVEVVGFFCGIISSIFLYRALTNTYDERIDRNSKTDLSIEYKSVT
jgi:hypothetical protein